MRVRGLLIAAVVLAALGVGAYFSNKAEKAKEGKPSTDAASSSVKVLAIPEDQVAKIELARKDADKTIVERGPDGKWKIAAPKPLPADQDAVNSMTSTISSLNSDRVVEDKASDLAQYGLNSPSLAVTVVKKDGKSDKLLIGDDTPTGSGAFAKLDNDPRVFTVASWNKSSLDKSPKDLRDKRLLTFDSDKLTRVEMIRKGQAVEFGKNNKNEWAILKPKPLRADGGQVEELVRKLRDAKMDTSASDEDVKKAASSFASGTQVAVAKVTDAAGTQQIEVRKDKDKNYYARSTAVEGIYKVTSEVGEGLDKDLDSFRNKKIFDFGWNETSKVDLRDGAKTYSLQKSGDKWMSGGKTMDSTSVQNLIDKLRDLQATKFQDAGFTGPAIDISVASNEGKNVEKVSLSKSGANWLAKRENEPTIYQVDAKAVEDIQKAAVDVKEAPAPAAGKK